MPSRLTRPRSATRGDVHRRYDIDAVPILVVADKDGLVRASFAGAVSANELAEALVGLH